MQSLKSNANERRFLNRYGKSTNNAVTAWFQAIFDFHQQIRNNVPLAINKV